MDTSGLFVSETSSCLEEDPCKRDDDEISITSPIASQHDSDDEWVVEGILYQVNDEGKDFYLVEWTGYPLEEATWEPEENVLGELLEEWKATQERQARGEEAVFDIVAWKELVDKRDEERREQHRRRNSERKRRGLEITLWEGESRAEYSSSEESISEDGYNAILPPPKPIARQDAISSVEPQAKQSLNHPIEDGSDLHRRRSSQKVKPKSPPKKKEYASSSQQRLQKMSTTTTVTGYQGTARRPAATTSVYNGRPSHTSLASKFSRPIRTAKKTQTGTRTMVKSSGNVFTSGKPIRSHARLSDTVADTTKDPRMFASHRLRRKAELQGREKADQAPTALPATLFSISNGPPPMSDSVGATTLRRSAMKRSVDELKSSASESMESERAESARPMDLEHSVPVQPESKRKKSVQWANVTPLVEEPEPMDIDSPPSDPSKRPKSPPPRRRSPPLVSGQSQPILRKLSISQYQQRNIGQDVEKRILLGPGGTNDVLAIFENVQLNSEAWHAQFINQEVLQFTRICNARTFGQQRTTVVERVLSHGSMRAKLANDQSLVDRAAERLRLGSLGATCFHEDFSVIIYPTECEDWKDVMAEADADSPKKVTLKYFIYKPYQFAIKPLPERKVTTVESRDVRLSILQNLLHLDYHQLTPHSLQGVHHNFYLIFPPSREAMLDTLSEWLHIENPSCRVFSTKTPGDWAAFTDTTIVSHGTIIVHETATSTLRRFPGLMKLLLHKHSAAYVFWCIGESLQQQPMYPSIRSSHYKTVPGEFELTRLFPHGNAVLVTPSFLVAEPRRAFQLFEWYAKTYQRPSNNTKIVAASSLCKFLRDLALGRSDQRKDLLARCDNARQSKSMQDEKLVEAKLTHEDCAAFFGTWCLVEGLQQPLLNGVVSDEQLKPIIFADENIDANDEQSLVNWFGCWSQTRLDQFRKFYVLGTDESADARHDIKLEDIPVYSPGTDRDLGAETQPGGIPETKDQLPGPVKQNLPMATKKLPSSASWAIKNYLFDLAKSIERLVRAPIGRPKPTVAKLFGYPVSCRQDMQAAVSAEDFHGELATYKKWFDFPWPFFSKVYPKHVPNGVPGSSPMIFNTYLAFFYTPQDCIASQTKDHERHPWLAVYRPTNPYLRPWKGTELLIWDASANSRFPTDGEILVSELCSAQKRLIEYVEEHGEMKNPGLPLRRVWLGGFRTITEPSPLDATLDSLEAMLKEPHDYIPDEETVLIEKGYRSVVLRVSCSPHVDGAGAMENTKTNALYHTADTLGGNIIFHPPRSVRRINTSRCENLLFKWVRDIARKDPDRSVVSYTFKPTLEWYNTQQVAENRHYEHIYVGTWQHIFELLRIVSENTKQDKPETREGTKQ
ncbi:chromo domain-containing protein [Colletotrichum truncatum]|uniref:Chromo domain-containing protein n=1 Tax=Colletotrichum truncatum TaxID=5467 RepID=A0ACC3Z992_COLTU|nr:chromo domain-containing protein [Colletotrichum truncatum]KAF6793550.1 chromo domain-containing protein [Colletotrichum truncatum]